MDESEGSLIQLSFSSSLNLASTTLSLSYWLRQNRTDDYTQVHSNRKSSINEIIGNQKVH
jgi:hypothetical protein